MLSKTVYSLLDADCEILKRFGILLKRKLSPVDDHELNDLLKLARSNYDPDIFSEINSRLESQRLTSPKFPQLITYIFFSLEKLLKARDATVLTDETNDDSHEPTSNVLTNNRPTSGCSAVPKVVEKVPLKTTLNPGTKLGKTDDKLKMILLYDWVNDELNNEMLD